MTTSASLALLTNTVQTHTHVGRVQQQERPRKVVCMVNQYKRFTFHAPLGKLAWEPHWWVGWGLLRVHRNTGCTFRASQRSLVSGVLTGIHMYVFHPHLPMKQTEGFVIEVTSQTLWLVTSMKNPSKIQPSRTHFFTKTRLPFSTWFLAPKAAVVSQPP